MNRENGVVEMKWGGRVTVQRGEREICEMTVLSIYYLSRKFSKDRFNKGFKKMTLKTGRMTPAG